MPGTEHTIFSLDSYRFGVTICWEAIFPDFFRRFVRQGTDFMVNITNESLFGESEAPYQFLSMIVFRAVENHISIARSAYTGISGFIDPNGRIIGTVNTNNKVIFVEGFLSRPIPLSRQPTFYTNFGDVFAFTCMAIATVGLLVSIGRLSLFQRRYKLYYE
jgi:apolipoprotein N-acyltransferase